MKRAMCVWFHTLSLDLLRRRERRRAEGTPRPADQPPILLVRVDHQRQVVFACCDRATRAGVRAGLPLAEARALCRAKARVLDHDPHQDRRALGALAQWAHRFTPVVAIDEPDGLSLDIGGCERVFGGEERLAARVAEALLALGFGSRIGVAGTFACARAAARFAADARRPVVHIPPGGERAAMTPWPIEALRLDHADHQSLREVGLERVGDALNLPRRVLPVRFGERLLLHLDRALGHAVEVISPVRAQSALCVERALEGPTTSTEALELITRQLLASLEPILASQERGVRRLNVTLDRPDLSPQSLTIELSRPTRDARHLWALLRPRLERVHLGFGVERVCITAARTARLRHAQALAWQDQAPDDRADLAPLIDVLVNRLGDARVRRLATADSHVPEHAWLARSTLDEPRPEQAEPADTPPRVVAGPSILLDPPEPARVVALTPDGPVVSVRWRGADYHAASCDGPERIEAEWWDREGPGRDYFTLRAVGGLRLWVFRASHGGGWFVHGVWG